MAFKVLIDVFTAGTCRFQLLLVILHLPFNLPFFQTDNCISGNDQRICFLDQFWILLSAELVFRKHDIRNRAAQFLIFNLVDQCGSIDRDAFHELMEKHLRHQP